MGGLVAGEKLFPGDALVVSALAHHLGEALVDTVGHQELRVLRPAVALLGEADLLLAERLAVGGAGVLLVWRAVADVAFDDDHRRPVVDVLGAVEGRREALAVVGVTDAQDVPAIGEEAGGDVLAEGERGVALDGDAVGIVDPDEVRQLQVARERGGLAGDALHHAAVTAERVDAVVEQLEVRLVVALGEPALGDRHADGGCDALAERTSGGLDAGGEVVFRVAGALRAELAEVLEVVEGHRRLAEPLVLAVDRLHAGEVQERVEQRRGVAGRQHEAVAVRPDRVSRVEAQELLPERIGDRCHRHRRARMAGVRLLHGIHRERANGVDGQAVDVGNGLRGARAPQVRGRRVGAPRCPFRRTHGSSSLRFWRAGPGRPRRQDQRRDVS